MAPRIPLQPLSCVAPPAKIPSTSSPCQAGELSFGGGGLRTHWGCPNLPAPLPGPTEGRGGLAVPCTGDTLWVGGRAPRLALPVPGGWAGGARGRAWSRYGQMTFPS